tara:strand:+ start:113 stop:958 length:846 start_codon:yes stop_codon:yes gene_type:complete
MAESNPTSAAVWVDDFINTSATSIALTPQVTLSNYPYSNLLNPLRSKRVRTSNTDAGGSSYTYHDFSFDLGSAKSPDCFALVDASISASQTVYLQGYDDSALTTGLVEWQVTSYAQSSLHNVLRYYLGSPDTGTLGGGKQYWRVRFAIGATSASGYAEVGQVMLGTHTALTISPPDESVLDGSRVQETDGGAAYVDIMPRSTELSIEAELLTRADYYTLTRALADHGRRQALIDIHAHSSDSTLRPYSARYGLISGRNILRGRLDSVTQNSFSFDFRETRG